MGFLRTLSYLVCFVAVWIGFHEYKLRQEISTGLDCNSLKLGEENPYWHGRIRSMYPDLLKTMQKFMQQRAQKKLDDPEGGLWKRVQHPISWGCVYNATFEGSNSLLSHLSMMKGKKFVDMRLSKNGFDPDSDPKVASIALKIKGVEGKRVKMDETSETLRESNQDTQDLVFVSIPTIPFFGTPEDLIVVHEYMMSYGVLPGTVCFLLVHRPTLLLRLLPFLVQGAKIVNPFSPTYFTIIPSKFDGGAVKWRLSPCGEVNNGVAPEGKKNFAPEVAEDYMKKNEVCFHMEFQKQTSPCIDRIDDHVNEWSGSWTKAGTIRIPKGTKLHPASACENDSYNPFHSLEEIRPTSWVARVRGQLYSDLAGLRLKENKVDK